MTYTNRLGQTYHLRNKSKKDGSDNFFFKIDAIEGTIAALPDGYEIYESPPGQVFCRKIKPKQISDEEMQLANREIRRLSKTPFVILDRVRDSIEVWTADLDDYNRLTKLWTENGYSPPQLLERDLKYDRVMRFILTDKQTRGFTAQRWCFRGSIDDWVYLHASGDLHTLIEKYARHLGAESFFELM